MSRRRTTRVVNYSEKAYHDNLEETLENGLEEEPKSTKSNSTPSTPGRGKRGKQQAQTETTVTNGAGYDLVPSNWQPKWHANDALTGVLDLTDAFVKGGVLHLSDGSTYAPGEHCYIVSEPPGEPYYIGRVMDFVINEENPPPGIDVANHQDSSWRSLNTRVKYPASQFLFQVNWFYRPKDLSKHVADSRLLYATMHSDVCALQNIRGKCVVTHRSDIDDIDQYRSKPNHFYFTQFYDRYILRFYEIVPTHTMINIPKQVYEVLCQRFKYAIMEINRKQEFCESPKECVACKNWSSPDDSVECAHCKTNYHMMCVTPPLTKKPTRGFGWSCAVCSRKVEKRLKEAKGEFFDDVIPEAAETAPASQESSVDVTPPVSSRSTSPDKMRSRYEELAEAFGKDNSLSEQQKHQLQLWPFRYLGVYAKIEDVLDVDDRIYPRAVSRLGPKHQAVVDEWPGRPVEYFGPFREAPVKRRGKRKTEDANFSYDPEKPWVQERPIGYIERGGPETSELRWDCNAGAEAEKKDPGVIDRFLELCIPHANKLGVRPDTPNYFDLCLKALMTSDFKCDAALKIVNGLTIKSIDEPVFTDEDKARFEDGVAKFGSELHPVMLEVGTQTAAHVVRYYYMWKKTANGRRIWGNFPGRKHKKGGVVEDEKKKKPKLDIGDDGDTSSYDIAKATKQKKSFQCKYCLTTSSSCWKRAPGGTDEESSVIIALCQRCARLWRRYAVVWEDSDEINRKLVARGGKIWAKKIETELLEDTQSIFDERQRSCSGTKKGGRKKSSASSSGTATPPAPVHIPTAREASAAAAREKKQRLEEERKAEEERERKEREKEREKEKERKEKEKKEKEKKEKEKEKREAEKKEKEKKEKEKEKEKDRVKKSKEKRSIETSASKKRSRSLEVDDETKKKPRTSTTPDLYKLKERIGYIFRGDRTPSTSVKKQRRNQTEALPCTVCGISNGCEVVYCAGCQLNVHRACYGISVQEPQLDSGAWYCDLCTNDAKPNLNTYYQCALCPVRDNDNESVHVSDPLKRTEYNHWAHIRCSVWNNKLSFGTPHLEPVLGVAQEIRYNGKGVCFICKTGAGVCISCRCCGQEYHAGCAFKQNYVFGFELLPESQLSPGYPIVEFNGQRGGMCAVTYCFWHAPDTVILPAETDQKLGKTAMQAFIENYKVDPQWQPRASDNALAMQQIYDINHEPRAPPDVPSLNKVCYKCHVGISPFWRKDDYGDLCQSCYHGGSTEINDLCIGLPDFSPPVNKLMHFDILCRSEKTYKRARNGYPALHQENGSRAETT